MIISERFEDYYRRAFLAGKKYTSYCQLKDSNGWDFGISIKLRSEWLYWYRKAGECIK
jgi:hypothetical protein